MFSVIIPLYNKAHTITRTLYSVLNQTCQKFEVIIINDGSLDDGIEQIENEFSDSRISIVSQKNQGVSVARNNGVKMAKFDYLAFLDGDDLWEPSYLEKIAEAIEQYPSGGLYCSAGFVQNSNGSVGLRLAKKYRNQILEINFFENPHVFIHTSAMVVKKEAFNQTKGFPPGLKRNEDFAFSFSLALKVQVVYIGIPLSTYVGGVAGQATSVDSKLLLLDIAKRHNLTFQEWLNSDRTNKLFLTFLKFELRHEFLSFIKDKNFNLLHEYCSYLDEGVMDVFPKLEKWLYSNKNRFCFGYIMLTKIKWRLGRYPRVGEFGLINNTPNE